jgi:hypothetical protein
MDSPPGACERAKWRNRGDVRWKDEDRKNLRLSEFNQAGEYAQAIH